jgi:hypothetical protein
MPQHSGGFLFHALQPMEKSSEALYRLNPVTFRFNSDWKNTKQYGLIAEEVVKVNPDLVVRDRNGEIYSVRYEAVNAMLLNEFLKEHRKNEQQDEKMKEQEATIAELKSGMETLAVMVKEQSVQIQKVSAQLEASGSAPQMAENNQ